MLTIDPLSKIHNGLWWITKHPIEWECLRCHHLVWDKPAVMAYRTEWDLTPDEHREWREYGWLVWHECQHCGYSSSFIPGEETYADDDAIRIWTKKAGGWKPMG